MPELSGAGAAIMSPAAVTDLYDVYEPRSGVLGATMGRSTATGLLLASLKSGAPRERREASEALGHKSATLSTRWLQPCTTTTSVYGRWPCHLGAARFMPPAGRSWSISWPDRARRRTWRTWRTWRQLSTPFAPPGGRRKRRASRRRERPGDDRLRCGRRPAYARRAGGRATRQVASYALMRDRPPGRRPPSGAVCSTPTCRFGWPPPRPSPAAST